MKNLLWTFLLCMFVGVVGCGDSAGTSPGGDNDPAETTDVEAEDEAVESEIEVE